MFTIKHISVGGDESLYEASYVSKVRCRGPLEAASNEPWRDVVTTLYEDGGAHDIHNGTVFVMNETGATVSRWDLGASPVPLRADVTGVNATLKMSVPETQNPKQYAAFSPN